VFGWLAGCFVMALTVTIRLWGAAHAPKVQIVATHAAPYTRELHNVTVHAPPAVGQVQRIWAFAEEDVDEVQLIEVPCSIGVRLIVDRSCFLFLCWRFPNTSCLNAQRILLILRNDSLHLPHF
jgi:hypothetical protein